MAATLAIRLGRSNFHRATKIHRPDPLAETRERGLSLPATMHRRLVGAMWIAAACLLIGCTDREIAEDGDDPALEPGEQPLAAGAMYSPCTSSSECPSGLCVFPEGELGFCSGPCSAPNDPDPCEPTPGDQPATCLDIGLPADARACALDCADAPCPQGMRCEPVMTRDGARSICF